MKFSKFKITSTGLFRFSFQTRNYLKGNGYWYYECRYFTISIVFRNWTIIIEV